MLGIRRREFLTLLGGSAAALTFERFSARAQQPAMPVVGYIFTGSPETETDNVAAFRDGLKEMGFADGRNVAIEFRWANNELGRVPELAADLVPRRVTVIAAFAMVSALAAKASTATIPIVFSSGGEPVQAGLVASLNRPGGNVTGSNFMSVELTDGT